MQGRLACLIRVVNLQAGVLRSRFVGQIRHEFKEKDMVNPHNESAASLWSSGGRGYDNVSYAISDALAHAAQRLWARPGERILDIGTGTGWTARNVARSGATVVGVDIADELLSAARSLSSHIVPAIEFQHADAESLPFSDSAFDGVISTFGLMFAPDQESVASELKRICKPGGRAVIAAWTPDDESYINKFFGVIAKYSDAPPPAVSPMAWGTQARVETLLGDAFAFSYEIRDSIFYAPDPEDVWDEYQTGFGPIKSLVSALPASTTAELRQEFLEFHEQYRSDAGLTLPRRYLLSVGVRS